jgi:hypothetical protein
LDSKIVGLVSADFVTSLVSFILVSATVLAIPVSLLLLRRYRAAVAREMSRAAADDEPAVVEYQFAEYIEPPSSPLAISVVDSRQKVPDSTGAELFFTRVRRRTNASVWVYSVAGAAFAAVMTYGWLVVTNDDARPSTKIAVLFWAYFWPTVLAIALVMATSSKARLTTLGGYGLTWSALVAWALSRNPDMSVEELPLYWEPTTRTWRRWSSATLASRC